MKVSEKEKKEQYDKAAMELVDWAKKNASLGPTVGILFLDVCLDFWFHCAGSDKAMEAIFSMVRAKIKELEEEKQQ